MLGALLFVNLSLCLMQTPAVYFGFLYYIICNVNREEQAQRYFAIISYLLDRMNER
jgi:hypothetical protein